MSPDQSPLIDARKEGKQGHRVLCLFDSRKATLIINIITLTLLILSFTLFAVYVSSPGVGVIIGFCISVLLFLSAIIGACSYRHCAVLVACIWEVIALVLNVAWLVMYDWSAVPDDNQTKVIASWVVLLVWRLLAIYADVTFVHEVRKGIMTRETRAREAYFCCCNV